jgi:hypothetical protein
MIVFKVEEASDKDGENADEENNKAGSNNNCEDREDEEEDTYNYQKVLFLRDF